jgi:hypothetical protein
MSTSSAPFGLQPAYSPSGVVRPTAFTIATGYNANIYGNQPVKINSSDGTLVAAAIGDAFIGSFQGVEWTDTDGKRRVSNKWTAATAGTDIVAYATLDPSLVYNIQANGSIAQSQLGNQANTTAITAGNSTVGYSQLMLDTATLTTSGNAQMRIIGITPGPDNAWGDNYTVVQVQISEHQNVANIAAY